MTHVPTAGIPLGHNKHQNRCEHVLGVCKRVWGQTLLHVSFRFQFSSWEPLGKSHKLCETFLICIKRIFAPASWCYWEADCDKA